MVGLTTAWGGVLAEAAAVCLEDQNHAIQTVFTGKGLVVSDRTVEWDATTDQCRRSHADLQEATEHGACGLAILFAHECTGKVVTSRSKKGTGFDYWLSSPDEVLDLPFSLEQTRLEVSGILKGSPEQISQRVKQKKKQMDPSDELGPGLVAVIEFGFPHAVLEIK